MRTRHLAGGTALSVLLATASLLGVTATPAAADSVTALPVASYSDMVVDGLHQRVFISSSSNSKIVVTDYDGKVVGQIVSEPGAAGLVLSPDSTTLFVAVPNADAISAIDTATLRETARYSIGAGSAPRYLAMNGDTVWFGYGGATQGNIGSLDLDPAGDPPPTGTVTTGGAVLTLNQAERSTWYSAPMVASSPGAPDMLAVGAPGQSPTELAVYDVSSGHAESKAYRFDPNGASNLQDLTVTPDGKQILAASGAPYFHQVYRTSDLSSDGRYTTDAYPNAVAVAADGTVAAGIDGAYEPDVYIFASQVDEPVRTYDLPSTGHSSGSDLLASGGLAWTPDGSRLFAVSSNDADVYSLRVLQDPTKAATTLTVNAPATALPGRDVTVTGTLGSAVPFADGTTVTVTRSDSATTDAPLGTATVAADGTFSLKDTPSTLGTTTYTVSYAGDAKHGAATTKRNITIARATTSLTVNAPATALPGRDVTVTGTLGSTLPLPAGTQVTVTRTDSAHQNGTPLGTAAVAADGTFTLKDTPSTLGTATYTVSYAGDADHAPATTKRNITIARATTTLTVNAPATAKRAAKITVTGKLTSGTALPAGAKVTVTRTDLTDPKGKSLGTKTVASNGTFSFTDVPYTGGNVTYTATYAGDATHNSGTGKDTVAVSRAATSVGIKTNLSVYSYGATATVTGHLGKTGKSRVVSIWAQPAGGTKQLVKTGTVNSAGDLKVTYKVSRNTNFWATFDGDFYSAPKSVSRYAGTQVNVSTSVSRYYKTGKVGSGNYYWFHKNTSPLFTTTMTFQPGRAQRFEVEVYIRGRWIPAGDPEFFGIASNGKSLVELGAPGESGIQARVRSSYIRGASGDTLNTGTYGPWKYVYFTK
ncbi:hypothetical protein ABZ883_10865 [Streptomyces sp. NPDC046977]|uniref:hypothetical protein n=1 Tax=Streptomyces sp. NPDC046977 TaxID=3154703 RepID=UPI0033F758A2